MRKGYRNVCICLMLSVTVWLCTFVADRQKLREELIRIHVVADSDSREDQHLKLRVRDAVMDSIRSDLAKISDPDLAKAYLREKLPYIQSVARDTLQALDCPDPVTVTLGQEAFDKRIGPEVSLPSGVYESLRIIIGSGSGENWWSVVFPEACSGSQEDGSKTQDVFLASDGKEGNSEQDIELRFWILDALGKLENIFFHG